VIVARADFADAEHRFAADPQEAMQGHVRMGGIPEQAGRREIGDF
jgi:hypothetical protein